MNKLTIDLVITNEWYEFPDFNSQEELNGYVGEEVPVKFNDKDGIQNFVSKWEKDHKFSIIRNTIDYYNLEAMYVIREVIFTIDEKYYRLFYKESCAYENSLYKEPIEVVPVEETIIKYVEKR